MPVAISDRPSISRLGLLAPGEVLVLGSTTAVGNQSQIQLSIVRRDAL
jgi:hypothetical protein